MQVLERATTRALGRVPVSSLVLALVVAEATVLMSFFATTVVVNPSVVGWMALPGAIVEHYILLFLPLVIALACLVGFGIARARGIHLGCNSIVMVHVVIVVLSYVQVMFLLSKQEYEPSIVVFGLYIAIFSLVLVSLLQGRDRREPRGTGDTLVPIVVVPVIFLVASAVLVPAFFFMLSCIIHLLAGMACMLAPSRQEPDALSPGWFQRLAPRPVPRRLSTSSAVLGTRLLLEGIVLGCGLVLAFERLDAFTAMTGDPGEIFRVLAGLLVHWSTLLGLGIVLIVDALLPRVLPVSSRFHGTMGYTILAGLLLASHAGVPVLSLACIGMLVPRLVSYLASMKGVVRPVVTFVFIVVLVAGYALVAVFASQGLPGELLDTIRAVTALVLVVAMALLVPVDAWWRETNSA